MNNPASLIARFHVEVCRPLERRAWITSGLLSFGCWIGGAAVALAITSWSYWLVGGFFGGVVFSILLGYGLERRLAPGRPARMQARLQRFLEAAGETVDTGGVNTVKARGD